MKRENIRSLHQGHADIRDWIVKHVPMADTTIGYELFVKLTDLTIDAGPIYKPALCAALRFPAADVMRVLDGLEAAGMLVVPDGADAQSPLRLISPALDHLLSDYFARLEHAFIPRDTLRQRQLLVEVADPARRRFVEEIYDRFFDIGWLYAHNYGAMCFMMSTLVKHTALRHGRHARVECGYLMIEGEQAKFGVGVQGSAGPGQIDGHAVCIIDDATLVDFGLGNVRRRYRRDFYWGLATDLNQRDAEMAAMQIPMGEALAWRNDWQPPLGGMEFQACNAHAGPLMAHYDAYFR
jgi:hypothetical protein